MFRINKEKISLVNKEIVVEDLRCHKWYRINNLFNNNNNLSTTQTWKMMRK